MVYKYLSIVSIALSIVPVAGAQVRGNVSLEGGLGTARNKAELNLDCDFGYFTIRPFVGIAGVDKEKWNLIDERKYDVFFDGDDYSSKSEVEYEGHTLFYGANFNTNITGFGVVEGNFVGNNIRMDGTGTFDDCHRIAYYDGLNNESYSHTKRNMPGYELDLYDADLSYLLRTNRKGENFKVLYKFHYVGDNNTQNDEISYDFFPALHTTLNYNQHAVEKKHNVSIDWNRPLAEGQLLNVGFEYEDRKLESHDIQLFNEISFIDTQEYRTGSNTYNTWMYGTKTYIYHAAYNLKKGAFAANARLDYHHTVQPYATLDDVVPTARLQYTLNDAQSLVAQYAQRIIRPDLDRLNPFYRLVNTYELYFGNQTLRGMHVNNASLIYQYKKGNYDFKASLTHIFCNDGFNALWYGSKSNGLNSYVRTYTWGNEGARRAWSFKPEFEWIPSLQTKVYAKGEVIWDKRIAESIDMAYEHWGATAELGATHGFLGKELYVNAHARYSEGNTLDLYSHEARSMKFGSYIEKQFFNNSLGCKLSYDYTEYPRIVIAQGVEGVTPMHLYGWVGSEYRHPKSHHNLTARIRYSF